jgi:hypothetical protein
MQKLIELREQLKRDLDAVELVFRRLEIKVEDTVTPIDVAIKRAKLEKPKREPSYQIRRRAPAGSFSTAVRQAIAQRCGGTFTSAMIQAELEKHAPDLLKAAGKSTLGSCLSGMVRREEINSLEPVNGRAQYRARKGFTVGDGKSEKERAYQAEREKMNIQVPRDDPRAEEGM